METRTRIGVAPLLFTAPHTIYLHRDAEADHKPEDLTGFLCETFAESTGGSALTWSRDISSISARTAQPQAGLRDPNYLRIDELPSNPWNEALRNALQRWPPWACLHCDLHGRRDHHPGINDDSVDASDCDCGLAAMRARAPPLLVRTIERALLQQLGRALSSTEFVLNLRPRLSGGWTNSRCTLSQQAVEFRYAAVQLELSLRLRRALHADDRLLSTVSRSKLVQATTAASVVVRIVENGLLTGRPSVSAAAAAAPALLALALTLALLSHLRLSFDLEEGHDRANEVRNARDIGLCPRHPRGPCCHAPLVMCTGTVACTLKQPLHEGINPPAHLQDEIRGARRLHLDAQPPVYKEFHAAVSRRDRQTHIWIGLAQMGTSKQEQRQQRRR